MCGQVMAVHKDLGTGIQAVKFQLDDEQQRRFCDPAQPARVRIDHPNYARDAEITERLAPSSPKATSCGLTPSPETLA